MFRKARAELGAQSFGMAVVELEPGSNAHPNHDHASEGQEEVFVVLPGAGEMEIDGETFPLDTETLLRVGPDSKRKLTPGPDGLRL